jgi:hypothetical protein
MCVANVSVHGFTLRTHHSHESSQVVLVSRHTFKKREFEVDSMYFGNKGLYEFRVIAFDAPPQPRSLTRRLRSKLF